jgi:ABC-type transport system involved in multi-copper enzyme maturation permease subunit
VTVTDLAPYRSGQTPGRDGFAQLLRSEWTKLRTVRGWIIGLVLAVLLTVLLGVLTAVGGSISCSDSPTGPTLSGAACRQIPPLGPDGEPVTDSFYLVHRTLTGNGSITVRVTGLSGRYSPNGAVQVGGADDGMVPGIQPWSKAGIIIKDGTGQGSTYAAMTTTGGNGVRMQYDYTHDLAGMPGQPTASSPQWLRLTRSGDTVTGYDSADGTHWTEVGSATLPGLPAGAQAGLFAASPDHTVAGSGFGTSSAVGGPSLATGSLDELATQGSWAGSWTGTAIGGGGPLGGNGTNAERFAASGGLYTVTGSGDIAPATGQQTGQPVERGLAGAFAGLIALIVVAALFVTAEYRRGLIRVTLAASPRRGRVLAAKAVVAGAAGFVLGLVAAVVTLPLADHLSYAHGAYLLPASVTTQARVVVGTAALFAVVAVFALGVGTLLRRSAATVTVVIVLIVLPYILATASVLPGGAAQWLARLTPAAAFAVQQTIVPFHQVTGNYTPGGGYFPLGPWTGLGVLCVYTALAFALAARRLRRGDA